MCNKLTLCNVSNYSHILIGSYDLLEDRCIHDVIDNFFILYMKQVDSMLLCIC